MKEAIYFASDEVAQAERFVRDNVPYDDLVKLDPEEILKRLFVQGFFSEGWNNGKFRRSLVKYLNNWSSYALKNLESSTREGEVSSRKEGLLLLHEYLRLATKNPQLSATDKAYDIALRLIDDPYVKKFAAVLYVGSRYPTLNDLLKTRSTKTWPKATEAEAGARLEHLEIFNEGQSYEEEEQVGYEEEQVSTEQLTDEHADEEAYYLTEIPPRDRFLLAIELLTEFTDLSKEEITQALTAVGINLKDLADGYLVKGLLHLARFEIERTIGKDDKMWHEFCFADMNDLLDRCVSLDDISSYESQLAYLIYLWILVQSPGADVVTYQFVEEKIEFSKTAKHLAELIKQEIDRRLNERRQIVASWRKEISKIQNRPDKKKRK